MLHRAQALTAAAPNALPLYLIQLLSTIVYFVVHNFIVTSLRHELCLIF
jgi:hypothetical protein